LCTAFEKTLYRQIHERNNNSKQLFLSPDNTRNKTLQMKKIIFATFLLVALSIASFAGGNEADKKLLSDLTMALKNSTQVARSSTADYTKATYSFNGKTVSAFYSPEDNSLIGFSIHVVGNDLPQDIVNAIQKKYNGWKIIDAIYFIDKNANGNYFAQVQKGKSNLALKVYANGKVGIYRRMPSE